MLNGVTLIASYEYNYKGERTRKVTTAAAPQGAQVVRYVYDNAGHLLEELTASGAPICSYVWRDDTPLAQIEQQPVRRIFYFEVDHLNTPRVARDQSGVVVWKWVSDAFGATPPNANPSGLGAVTINLRFPGQYYDQETGLYYNGHRYYDPVMGVYIQSDPIGLAGGSFSTYTYVDGNPLSFIDPLGLYFYNKPAPRTIPVTGPTETSLGCLEICLKSRTPGTVNLRVSGGSEAVGHSKNSDHPKYEACDISNPNWNKGIDNTDMFDCAKQCGFKAGQYEEFVKDPANDHWHFQLEPGNNVPAMPSDPYKLPPDPYDMTGPIHKIK